jgi:hypothetical protein
MKLETISSRHVEFMPKQLEPGILYVSEKYGTAAHLCACGCGAKIRTPLGSTEWAATETMEGPSLWPSVGNWQQECQSHYVIRAGKIIWCGKWTPEEILAGRQAEEARRKDYYDAMYGPQPGLLARIWRWIKSWLGL